MDTAINVFVITMMTCATVVVVGWACMVLGMGIAILRDAIRGDL